MTPGTAPARATSALAALALATVLLAAPGAQAVGAPAPPDPTSARYVLPTGDTVTGQTRRALRDSGLLVEDFAPPSVRWGAGHRGVDLRLTDGAPVLAPQAGVVTFTGVVVDRPLVVITHPDGLRSTLEPVTSELTTGTTVTQGTAVGVLAPGVATHCVPASCLHWGVRRGEEYVDPLGLVVVLEPVVLLPLAGA